MLRLVLVCLLCLTRYLLLHPCINAKQAKHEHGKVFRVASISVSDVVIATKQLYHPKDTRTNERCAFWFALPLSTANDFAYGLLAKAGV